MGFQFQRNPYLPILVLSTVAQDKTTGWRGRGGIAVRRTLYKYQQDYNIDAYQTGSKSGYPGQTVMFISVENC